MVKVRQDAWSHEDDLLLAETVLRHIREGSTQLNAFEEVGDKLNRTSAACGFRWNAEVRQRYDQAVSIAKRQRKEKKRALARQQSTIPRNNVISNMNMENMEEQVEMEDFSVETNIPTMTNTPSTLNLDNVIDYLETLKRDYYESNRSKNSIQKLQKENEMLLQEKNATEKKMVQLHEQLNTIQEDYQVLIQIMDRARKMVVFDDDNSTSTPAFRMEKNGNLEQVAK
ncbi:RsfA family transcriptional regulator [Aquibacillus halophilus]|uniref:RsfA family transcriptional regulator n=1 Tax=Aquibacillus halophilus TaxID=930132 RepID=A0A6A8DCN0_9BACI|nr:RsfA family transcriptional regulator [Aquibacillus halophilus]MRH43020.1 RsfA family transcriptional regulator [Aquibacillus halophilus]